MCEGLKQRILARTSASNLITELRIAARIEFRKKPSKMCYGAGRISLELEEIVSTKLILYCLKQLLFSRHFAFFN